MQEKDAGVDLAESRPQEETKSLICEEAHRVLQQYTLGVQHVSLKGLGVNPINRSTCGSHVHALGRRIVSVEGVRVVAVSPWLGT